MHTVSLNTVGSTISGKACTRLEPWRKVSACCSWRLELFCAAVLDWHVHPVVVCLERRSIMEHGMMAIIMYTSNQLLKREYLIMFTEIFGFCDECSSHQPLVSSRRNSSTVLLH